MSRLLAPFLLLALSPVLCFADDPATRPAGAAEKLPHVHVDVKGKRVSVDCEALAVESPLEFFCVTNGGNEHESVLRTPAKPSDIHFALLMLGLTPGAPATYSEARQSWSPPHGPPLHLTCKYSLKGREVSTPAYRMVRSVKDKKEMPPSTWVFDGSRVMPDGVYAADVTGYVVSICNFDLTLIDVPALVSNANETLEWEENPDLVPPKGTAVTLVIEAAGDAAPPPATPAPAGFNPGPGLTGKAARAETPAHSPAAPTPAATPSDPPASSEPAPPKPAPPGDPAARPAPLSDVHADQAEIDRLHARWEQAVRPHRDALREAAQAHYEVIAAMRREQQRLIDEADRIQRTIDELEKDYQDMTTPRPEPATQPAAGAAAP